MSKKDIQEPSADGSINMEKMTSECMPFLGGMGFTMVDSSPNLIRYKNGEIEIEVYWEPLSHEVGLGINCYGIRYSLSEIIRTVDPIRAEQYRDPSVARQDDIAAGLKKAGELLVQYGGAVLQGDLAACDALAIQRKSWSEEYELSVLAAQVRPKAEEAFRNQDYEMVVKLYASISQCLSKAELGKLAIAQKRLR